MIAPATFQAVVKTYLCPSDNSQTINPYYGSGNQPITNGTYAKNNYVINRYVCGPDALLAPSPFDNGVVVSYKTDPASLLAITDGTSNTFMIGERETVINIGALAFIRHGSTTSTFEGRPGGGINPNPMGAHQGGYSPGSTVNCGGCPKRTTTAATATAWPTAACIPGGATSPSVTAPSVSSRLPSAPIPWATRLSSRSIAFSR